MPTLTLPRNLTSSTARDCLRNLPEDGRPGDDTLVVNADALAFAKVAGAALLVEAVCAWAARTGGSVEVAEPAAPRAVHSWLAWLGLFRELGSDWGRAAPPGTQGDSYLPLTVLRREALVAEAARLDKPLGHVIHLQCVSLAEVVTQKKDGKVVEPIAYCLRELIRNVFEHAGVDRCTLVAQKTTKKDCVEMVVVDAGVGIRQTLARRHPVDTDAEALREALLPGRSGSATFGGAEPYANSGFGLYVLSELGRRTGSFRLASGTADLKVEGEKETITPSQWQGTAVELSVSKPKGVNFPAYLEEIIQTGEHAGPVPHRASLSTRLMPL